MQLAAIHVSLSAIGRPRFLAAAEIRPHVYAVRSEYGSLTTLARKAVTRPVG